VHDHTDFSLLYDALGIRPGCSVDELRAAYRRVAAGLHPDAGGRGVDVEKLQQINRIYHAATQFQRMHGRLPGERTPVQPPPAGTPARGTAAHGAPPCARGGEGVGTHALAVAPMAGPGRRLRSLLLAGVLAAVVAGLLELHRDAAPGADRGQAGADAAAPSDPAPADGGRRMVLGMAPAEVLVLSGPPLSAHDRRWDYGPSWVAFDCGAVSDWYSSPLRPIHRGPARPEHSGATVRERCRKTGK
jgi:hypothetical protein